MGVALHKPSGRLGGNQWVAKRLRLGGWVETCNLSNRTLNRLPLHPGARGFLVLREASSIPMEIHKIEKETPSNREGFQLTIQTMASIPALSCVSCCNPLKKPRLLVKIQELLESYILCERPASPYPKLLFFRAFLTPSQQSVGRIFPRGQRITLEDVGITQLKAFLQEEMSKQQGWGTSKMSMP